MVVFGALLVSVLCGAVRADWMYEYVDDFGTGKAKEDSYSHSVFWPDGAFPPNEPYLVYVGGWRIGQVLPDVDWRPRALLFMGYDAVGAHLNYCFPLGPAQGLRAVKGTVAFDAWPLQGDALAASEADVAGRLGYLSYRLSADGHVWTLPTFVEPGHHEVSVASAEGTCYISFQGDRALLDNLRVKLSSPATTIRVPQDVPTIQAAIDAAGDGDVVAVAPGTYKGPGNRDLDFRGKAITVTSTDGPEVTVIDCAGSTGSADGHRGVYFHSDEGPDSILRGFTIQGGFMPPDDSALPLPGDGEPWGRQQAYPIGGGIYCELASPTIVDCVVQRCRAWIGGGIAVVGGAPRIVRCRVERCQALDGMGPIVPWSGYGSGMALLRGTEARVIGTDIQQNGIGGNTFGVGVYARRSRAAIVGCRIVNNGTEITGPGGPSTGAVGGGGLFLDVPVAGMTIQNCIIVHNRAVEGAGLFIQGRLVTIDGSQDPGGSGDPDAIGPGRVDVVNCTIAHNRLIGQSVVPRGGGIYGVRCDVRVRNGIVYYNDELQIKLVDPASNSPVAFCDVQGGYVGIGNIDELPLFASIGTDGAVPDYHLRSVVGRYDPITGDWVKDRRHSPCIDAGDPRDDYDKEPEPNGGRINMGAYGNTAEASMGRGSVAWHVDGINGDDANSGLSRDEAVEHIQTAIDRSRDGDVVFVWPAIYPEAIDLLGKAITVQSAADAAIIEAGNQDAVTMHSGEGRETVLKNFVIRRSGMAVSINFSSPTLTQLTITENRFGIAAYEDSRPDISNCIFHANAEGDLEGCTARFSVFTSMYAGPVPPPLFADPEADDYHLVSRRGRYDRALDRWVLDDVDSIALDAGDPRIDPRGERMPNGGRVNAGAFGGTAYASMSPWPLRHDANTDGRVDLEDLATFAAEWLKMLPWTRPWPVVRIVEPQDGQVIPYAQETIPIVAVVKDPDGVVRRVEFFANGHRIGVDKDPADGWSTAWWGHTPGRYALTAAAVCEDGTVAVSPQVVIRVVNYEPGQGNPAAEQEQPVGTATP